MRKKCLACYFLIVIIVFLCITTSISVAASPPKWVTELGFKEDVIETVGFASEMPLPEVSLEMADNWARGEMAKVLAAVIKASIRTSFKADETLATGRIDVFYKKVVELYAEKTIEGLAIVDHYIDPETGITYALARLKRKEAMKDASMKAKLTVSGSESLFDELTIQAAIKARLTPIKPEFLAATGRASVLDTDPEKKSINYEKAMRMAQTSARVALAQQVRTTVTSSVKEWLEAHESNLSGDSSTDIFYETITKSFTNVKLDGARIMKRYFGENTKIAYAQAVMDRQWIADEFSHAAASAIEKNVQPEKKADVEKRIDSIIHKSLKLLLKENTPKDAPETQSQIAPQEYDMVGMSGQMDRFPGWEWWRHPQQQGIYNGCLYGVGSDLSKDVAEVRALNSLAKYTGVTIRTKIKAIFEATKSSIDSSYFEDIDVTTNKDFYGVIYHHHFDDSSSIWFSIAYIPPAPSDVSICIDERINGRPAGRGHVRSMLQNDLIENGYTVRYLRPRYTQTSQTSENPVDRDSDTDIYMAHLSRVMIIGEVEVTTRPSDVDPEYGEHTKDWKTAEVRLNLGIIDTRSLNILASLVASGRNLHKQESIAIRGAIEAAYKDIPVTLLDQLRNYKGDQ